MRNLVFAAALLLLGGFARDATAATSDDVHGEKLQQQLKQADDLYNQQQWDEAIAAYRSIQKRVPTLSVALLQIASAYRNKKDYDGAIAAYKKLLATGGGIDAARIGLGYVYIEQGNFRAAEESLLKVSRPTPEVLYNIAELKLAQGHPEQAAIWYRKAMHLDPSWDKPASRLALVEGSKPAVAAGGGSR